MSETPDVDDLNLDRVLNQLSKQADDVLEEGTDWVELGQHLEVPSTYRKETRTLSGTQR